MARRSSFCASSRCCTATRSRSSKISTRPRPRCLAWYIATSASRMRSSGSGLGDAVGEGDADAGADGDLPHGRADLDGDRLAHAVDDPLGDADAASTDVRSSQMTTNSSPARRATVSPVRLIAVSRAVIGAEHLVAGFVAERVVDDLEAVQVDEDDSTSVRPVLADRSSTSREPARARRPGWAGRSARRGSPGSPAGRWRPRSGRWCRSARARRTPVRRGCRPTPAGSGRRGRPRRACRRCDGSAARPTGRTRRTGRGRAARRRRFRCPPAAPGS